jgi:LmbE family N-acetylglucosaminyl deacetylase
VEPDVRIPTRIVPVVLSLLLIALSPLTAASAMSLTASDRVLIVAPHPDDESLCCAGLIQRARGIGAEVGIVWITDGDGFEIDAALVERTLRPRGDPSRRLGLVRRAEARAAADALGVRREHQYFLGYPDRGLRDLLNSMAQVPLKSPYTGESSVGDLEAVRPGAAYTGANLRRDLGSVLDSFAPTWVLAAAPQDLHADHAASGALTRQLLMERRAVGRMRLWIVHAGHHWPRPRRYAPGLPLLVPQIAQELAWQTFALHPDEVRAKRDAILQHRSQVEVMKPFLLSFARRNELFAEP